MMRTNISDSELAALAARIQQDYDYDERRGKLVNRKTGRAVRGRNGAKRNGVYRYMYMSFRINDQRMSIRMHIVVWAWHHGCFPTMQIDHINGVETDNRIENLREVSGSENKLNQLHDWNPNPITGLPGFLPNANMYQTKIQGKNFYFTDPFEAFMHATLCGKMYR